MNLEEYFKNKTISFSIIATIPKLRIDQESEDNIRSGIFAIRDRVRARHQLELLEKVIELDEWKVAKRRISYQKIPFLNLADAETLFPKS